VGRATCYGDLLWLCVQGSQTGGNELGGGTGRSKWSTLAPRLVFEMGSWG